MSERETGARADRSPDRKARTRRRAVRRRAGRESPTAGIVRATVERDRALYEPRDLDDTLSRDERAVGVLAGV